MPQWNWKNQKYTQPVLQLIVEYIVSMLLWEVTKSYKCEGFMFKSNIKKGCCNQNYMPQPYMHLKRMSGKILEKHQFNNPKSGLLV